MKLHRIWIPPWFSHLLAYSPPHQYLSTTARLSPLCLLIDALNNLKLLVQALEEADSRNVQVTNVEEVAEPLHKNRRESLKNASGMPTSKRSKMRDKTKSP